MDMSSCQGYEPSYAINWLAIEKNHQFGQSDFLVNDVWLHSRFPYGV